ncbi:MAG: GNAT family N-acetyltransferase [Ginsengibacter sp.]
MPIKQIEHHSREYKQMIQLRYDILRKPLNLRFDNKELEKEKEDILIGAFDEDTILGCCLLHPLNNKEIRLRQMAVQNNLQGKGIGAAIMNYAENISRDKGYKMITMHARMPAIGFYERLGYKIVGEEFMEVSIPHFKMQKKLRFPD